MTRSLILQALQKIKYQFSEAVIEVIETSLTRRMLFKLHACWYSKVLILQRGIRKLLAGRRILKLFWRVEWNQMEKRSLPQKKLTAKRRLSVIQVCGATSIPDQVKDFYIKKFILKRVREYIQALRLHHAECKRLNHLFQRRRRELEIQAWGKKIEFKITLPPSPQKNYRMGLEDYRELIKEALSNRTDWESIIKDSEYRKSLAYPHSLS
jgi:hypothetical protein